MESPRHVPPPGTNSFRLKRTRHVASGCLVASFAWSAPAMDAHELDLRRRIVPLFLIVSGEQLRFNTNASLSIVNARPPWRRSAAAVTPVPQTKTWEHREREPALAIDDAAPPRRCRPPASSRCRGSPGHQLLRQRRKTGGSPTERLIAALAAVSRRARSWRRIPLRAEAEIEGSCDPSCPPRPERRRHPAPGGEHQPGGFDAQPFFTNSTASQSSSSGCVGCSPIFPKLSSVATMPRPKW